VPKLGAAVYPDKLLVIMFLVRLEQSFHERRLVEVAARVGQCRAVAMECHLCARVMARSGHFIPLATFCNPM